MVRQASPSAGAAWVTRFLLPHLQRRFPDRQAISCLQIAPDDPTEAEQLRRYGYSCEMVDPGEHRTLSFPESSFDFVFTGRFPVLASDAESRVAFAKELHRVLKKGGSLLLVFGNQSCPIDLTRNGSLLHGLKSRHCLSLHTAEQLLIQEGEFTSIQPLNIDGHFGWGSLPAPLHPFGKFLDFHWRFLATPARRWLYSSALNPTLILWLNKE
ncbi:class I SAM-dependent methyltransferase [Verrucomicrobiota bacterium sgz303538]